MGDLVQIYGAVRKTLALLSAIGREVRGIIWRTRIPLCLLYCAVFSSSSVWGQQQEPDLGQMSLEDLMKVKVDTVYGASKFLQKVADAPASVTIVTGEQIQKYGYRTLADVLRSVRGFYVIYDRNYTYVGLRGFSQPGDYNARILFLVDGHRENDNIYDGAYVATEFPVDVDLIDHIEIIRGAGSCVYGTGALVAVVNVVTKRGRDVNSTELSAEAGSFNSYKARATFGRRLNNGVEMLLSGTVYDSLGHSRLFFPEYNNPATNNGIAQNVDGDKSYSLFADVIHGGFNIHAVANSRTKHIPTGSFGTVFNDPLTRTTDARSYIDVQYSHTFGEKWEILGRASYDWYGYNGVYTYDYAGNGIPPFTENIDLASGSWSDFQFDASRVFWERHRISLGTEFRQDFQQRQANYDAYPFVSYLNDHRGSTNVAYYLQDEFSIRRNLIVVGGLRSDWYQRFGNTYSPRLGLIYSPTEETRFKLIYNRAFRAPNSYEAFYVSSVSNTANPSLQPEKIRTIEVELEQHFGEAVRLTASGYLNRIDGLIALRTNPVTGALESTNGDILHGKGVELELAGKWPGGIEGVASYSVQNSRSQQTGNVLTNSPKQLGKANLSIPLVQKKLFTSFEGQFTSRRTTVAGPVLGSFVVMNATLLTRNLKKGFDVSASIYNIFDKRYADSGGTEHRELSIPQDGRSFEVKLTYRIPSMSR